MFSANQKQVTIVQADNGYIVEFQDPNKRFDQAPPSGRDHGYRIIENKKELRNYVDSFFTQGL